MYPHSWLACERCAVAQRLRTRSQNDDNHGAQRPDDGVCLLARRSLPLVPARTVLVPSRRTPSEAKPPGQCEPTTHIMAQILEVVETILEEIKDTPLDSGKGKVKTEETYHQRVDQPCPDDNFALNMEGVKQARKSSRGRHTRLRFRAQRKRPMWSRITNDWTTLAQVIMSLPTSRASTRNNTPRS